MTTTDRPDDNPPGGDMPFLAHLVELRDRLLRIVLSVIIIFLILFPFANELYLVVAEPLLRHLPEGTNMIATEVASPFLTPFKLTLVMAIFLSMPVILYQGWTFVAPGLYKHERRIAFPLLIVSIFLFYLGMVFAYYLVFPLVFGFFTSVAPDGVEVMTDIARYLDFVLKLFFAFGLAFEVPIVAVILVWTGMTTPDSLAEKRPYIIVGAFVFGMLLTPPDVISQTLLALPMWVLFEMGVFFSRSFVRREEEPEPYSGNGPEGDTSTAPEDPDTEDEDLYRDLNEEELEEELSRAEAEEGLLDEAYEPREHKDPPETGR